MNTITLVDASSGYSIDRRAEPIISSLVPTAIAGSRDLPDRRILHCLQAMDLLVQRLSRSEFMSGQSSNKSILTLFICDKSSFVDREFLDNIRAFQTKCSPISLCILSADSVPDDESLPDIFDDFIYWPCASAELKLRLAIYLKPIKPDRQDIFSQQKIADFSQLNLCGKSKNFTQVLQLIEKMSQHQATVLIQGETGTGKENAARAIHYLGTRAACPFVPINCATIPDDLLESELFGHEKGAFTDAKQTKEGLIALANGGTLFLDEVDSLSAKAQAALLRFLQTREYRPVGGKRLLSANVRIVAATNADLKQLSQAKLFREDLFFRLNVFNLIMPPLRDRKDDMELIADNLVQRFAKDYNLPIKLLSRKSLALLKDQSWPGNVREFENTLLRSFLLSTGKYLEIDPLVNHEEIDEKKQLDEDLKILPDDAVSFQEAKAIAIESFEKDYLSRVMNLTQGNVTMAAKIAGKERRALGKLLQKYQIDKYQYKLLQ